MAAVQQRSQRLIELAICVPVRNEQALLPDFLRACEGLDMSGVRGTLCLYFDGCTDRSEAVAAEIGAALPFGFVTGRADRARAANAGRARRAAMDLGLATLGPAEGGLLLSSDADSAPDRNWVQAACRALALADVAAGMLVRDDGARDHVQTRVETYYDRLHAHRRALDPTPWDTHGGCHHGGGANLGTRAGVYRALGGFRAQPAGEDARFLDDAARAGWRVRRDPAMIVRTSSRRIGRAAGGLATALRDIDIGGLPRVAHPAAADWQYRAQRFARETFARLSDPAARAAFGRSIGLGGDHVLGVGRDCPNAEAFAMRIVPAPPGLGRPVPLAEAEAALATLEQMRCEQAA